MLISELLQELGLSNIVKYFHISEVTRNNRSFNVSSNKISEQTDKGSWSFVEEKKKEV